MKPVCLLLTRITSCTVSSHGILTGLQNCFLDVISMELFGKEVCCWIAFVNTFLGWLFEKNVPTENNYSLMRGLYAVPLVQEARSLLYPCKAYLSRDTVKDLL